MKNGSAGDGEANPEAAQKTTGAEISTQPAPPAPPIPGQNINLALGVGMNLQRTPLEALPHEAQMRMIQLSDDMDQRMYDYHCKSLERDADYSGEALKEKGAARKQALWTFGLLGGGCLLLIGAILVMLLSKDQYQTAQVVLVASLTFFAGLFGGSGLPGLLKQLGGGP